MADQGRYDIKMKWLKAIFDFRYPWDQEKVRGRLRPLRFRVAEEKDLAICEALHAKNEAFGVPSNHRDIYSSALRSGEMLTLICEDNGVPVGCCGIQWQQEGLAWLCYGLVDPALHRTGIGTTMFIARMALLPTAQSNQKVGISALETSLSFYLRFGFRLVGHFNSDNGNRYPIAFLEFVSTRLIEDCREMLREAGAVVLADTDQIPMRKEPNQVPE